MKKSLALLLTFGMVCSLSIGLVGCTKDKGKDAKADDKEKMKHSLEASADPEKATMKPGETKVVEIKLKRGEKATKEVALTAAVDPADKGVAATLDPAKTDKNQAKLSVKADDKADGDYTVTVTGKLEGSPDAKSTVKIKVEKTAAAKDTKLSVSDPKGITVKQGEKGTVKMTVTLGDGLTDGATVKAWIKDDKDKDVKGLEAAADPKSLEKTGDTTVTVAVGEAVAAGEYTLTIETAAKGATPDKLEKKVSVKVEKK